MLYTVYDAEYCAIGDFSTEVAAQECAAEHPGARIEAHTIDFDTYMGYGAEVDDDDEKI